jgi:hypothetical protein
MSLDREALRLALSAGDLRLALRAHMHLIRHDDAIRHLAEAEASVVRTGMRGHLARLRYELGRALLLRGRPEDPARAAMLLADARAIAVELGQVGLLPLIDACASAAEPNAADDRTEIRAMRAPAFSLTREGEVWAISSGTQTLHMKDSRGLTVLARLLAHPREEIHVLDLLSDRSPGEAIDGGDAGPLLDEAAIASYRRRLRELRSELDDAEGAGDPRRVDRAQEELDLVTEELARAVGLGGRERRAGGAGRVSCAVAAQIN